MKRNGRLVKRIVTQESVNRYCEWLYGCEKSSGTIKQYKHYLLLFMQYMNGKSVEKRDVIMWKGILRERMAPVTVNSALAAVNGFLTHNAWQDCRTKFLKVSRRVFCPESREIDRDEYKRLVKCAYKKGDETRLSKLAPYSLGAYFIYCLVKRLGIRLFLLHKYFLKNFICVIIMVIVVILSEEVSYGLFS